MRYTLLLLLLLTCSGTFAQSTLKGVVLDIENNKPVPYVSIGIINKVYGTVSNTAGEFKISLDDKVSDTDTLKFSSIGYKSKAFLVGEIRKTEPLSILLDKAVNELKTVNVDAHRVHVKILGNETTSKLLGFGFASNSIGSQAGVRIPVKHPNTNIENCSFFIIQNTFEHLTFRLNVYAMNDGQPGNSILTDNIIVQIAAKQAGKITVDLSAYNIITDKDVLVAMEWIDASVTPNGQFAVAAVLFGSSYFKQSSQFYWQKKHAGLGLSVKANY